MKRVDLIKREHNTKIGDVCPTIEPNITEDCIFYENNIPIGFFIKDIAKYSEKSAKLADLADKEFRSSNVPKTEMARATVSNKEQYDKMMKGLTEKKRVSQMSCIIGSIAPKAQFKRNYYNYSTVHQVKSAQTFIKAMLMLAIESEKIIKEITPNIYETQKKIFENVPEKWRFGNLFTSSISNYNIAANFHRDTANIENCVNVIITKRLNATGGNLHIPDYGVTMDSCDNSMLVYPAWKNIHGVTPIIPTHEGGYRNSLIFYPLKAFYGLDK
jgi:hypothetical protein